MKRVLVAGCWSLLSSVLLFFLVGGCFAMGLDFGGGGESPSVPVLELSPGPLASPVRLDNGTGQDRPMLLVADYAGRAIYRVNRHKPTRVKRLFRVEGHPLGLARYKRSIFVGNLDKGIVERYRRNGRLLTRYRLPQKMKPYDLAIDPERKQLLVVDGRAKAIQVFSLKGAFLDTRDGFGELFDPKGIALDAATGQIAISDLGDPLTGMPASVQLFDSSGARLWRASGSFSAPRGLTFAGERLLVTDALLGQVLVFDRAGGAQLPSLGSFGTDPGQLLFPLDVAYDPGRGELFVANNRLGRVTVLTAAGL